MFIVSCFAVSTTIRDFGSELTWNIQTITPNHAQKLLPSVSCHSWLVQNNGTNTIWLGFNANVDEYLGFKLLPGMIIGDSGSTPLYIYTTATNNVILYKRLRDQY